MKKAVIYSLFSLVFFQQSPAYSETFDAQCCEPEKEIFLELYEGNDLNSPDIAIIKVDINDDTKQDFLAQTQAKSYCGSAGCSTYLVVDRTLTRLFNTGSKIQIGPSKTNGFKDLFAYGDHKGELCRWKKGNDNYEFAGCANYWDLIGKSYHQARAELIEQGWRPLQTQLEGTNRQGNGDLLWELGYKELGGCSGTGEAICSFSFIKEQFGGMYVSTYGEETGDSFATVRDITPWKSRRSERAVSQCPVFNAIFEPVYQPGYSDLQLKLHFQDNTDESLLERRAFALIEAYKNSAKVSEMRLSHDCHKTTYGECFLGNEFGQKGSLANLTEFERPVTFEIVFLDENMKAQSDFLNQDSDIEFIIIPSGPAKFKGMLAAKKDIPKYVDFHTSEAIFPNFSGFEIWQRSKTLCKGTTVE